MAMWKGVKEHQHLFLSPHSPPQSSLSAATVSPPFSLSKPEKLNTSACLSLLLLHHLQTPTQCRQEKSIIASLSVTIYLPYHLGLSLANPPTYPTLPAIAHTHTQTAVNQDCDEQNIASLVFLSERAAEHPAFPETCM